jgi:type I restriction enzyme S subunit
VDSSVVTPRYLFHILRSRLCTAQFEQRSSGGNYPAITEEQLLKLLIPLPKNKTPAQVAALLDQRYAKAEEMLEKAENELDQAKHEIESLILGHDQ